MNILRDLRNYYLFNHVKNKTNKQSQFEPVYPAISYTRVVIDYFAKELILSGH